MRDRRAVMEPADRAALFDVLVENIVAMRNGQPMEQNDFWCRLNAQIIPRKRYTAAEFAGLVRAAARSADSCRKCSGQMRPGIAMGQTTSCSDEGTCSPGGPGYLRECMKCVRCGWSVSPGAAVENGA